MACTIKTKTTQLPSELYNQLLLLSEGSESLAKKRYGFLRSDMFKRKFGDFEQEFEDSKSEDYTPDNIDRTDHNGEPKLFFDENIGKHYMILENNKKMYYPSGAKQLDSLYTVERKVEIIKALALDFISGRIGEDFNDFDFSLQEGNLEDSIRLKIQKGVLRLRAAGGMSNKIAAKNLENSLEHIDEWVEGSKDYLRSFGISYNEELGSPTAEFEEDETRTSLINKASFEKVTKDSVTANVKLKLSLMRDGSKLDSTFLEPTLIEFDDIYGTLLNALSDKVSLDTTGQVDDMFNVVLAEIAELSYKKPYFKLLLDILQDKSFDKNSKAQFLQTFNLHSNRFLATTFEVSELRVPVKDPNDAIVRVNGKVMYHYPVTSSVIDLSTTGSKTTFVKNEWSYNYFKKFVENKNVADLRPIIDGFTKMHSDNLATFNKMKENSSAHLNAISDIMRVLNSLGMNVSKKELDHYLDGGNIKVSDFTIKKNKLGDLYDSTLHFLTSIDKSYVAKAKVDVFNDQKAFNELASAKAFYLTVGMDSSISTGGKTKSLFSNPSYLSTKILKWKGNPELLKNHYHSSKYNEGSYYMKKLLVLNENESDEMREYKSKSRLEEFTLHLFNSLQSDVKNETVSGSEMSKKDAYADLYSKLLGAKAGRKSYFNGPTPADKSQQYTFSIPSELFVDSDSKMVDGTLETTNDEAYEILFQYVRAEHERIKQVQREIDAAGEDQSNLTVHYHLGNKNGLKFQLMKSLNFEQFKADKSNTAAMYTSDGRLIDLDLNDSPELKSNIMDTIKKHVTSKVNSTLDHLVEQELLQVDNGEFSVQRLPLDIWKSYNVGSRSSTEVATKIAADIVFNGVISQVEFSKMFSGDVAYYKNMVDYKKRVPATYTDGLTLYLEKWEDEYFNIASMSGVEITTPYINDLKELIGNSKSAKAILEQYKNGNSTDAQAWITPERWKFLLGGLGKWSSKHDVLFAKFEKSERLTQEELKMAAQPLKGVYFDIVDGVPVYLKYSQAVLLPEVLSNNPELKALHDKMIDGKISELITIDGVKVGSLNPSVTHDAEGNALDASKFKLTPQKLRNEGWKLQQDLPTKTFKDTDVGSQIQKNIFAGLADNLTETFQIGDQLMSGEEVVTLLHDLTNNMTEIGKSKLEKELGISSDFEIKDSYKLNKILIDELKSRGANADHIAGLEEGLSTYGLPGANNKVQSVFASIVLDRLIRIKTNGGSFIQMSNYGFNNAEANNKGVVWTPWSKDKTYEYSVVKDEKGEPMIGENGKPLVKPSGILLSGSFIEKYIPDWYKYKSKPEVLFGELNESTGKYEGGMISHEILTKIIGYRIPNQGLASNDAFEIAGILPASMGDTVVAYTSITTKTGSDFDIDKMYLMMPSYKAIRVNQQEFRQNLVRTVSGDNIQEVIDNLEDLLDEAIPLSKIDNITLGRMILDAEDLVENSASENYSKMTSLLDEVIDVVFKDPESKAAKTIIGAVEEYNASTRLEYIKPDYSKKGDQKSLRHMQNMLIETYASILTHPNNMKEVLTPIDYDFIKNDIVNIAPAPNNGEFSDFLYEYEVELKYDFLGGKAGIGQNANALVNHITGSLANTTMPKYFDIGRYDLQDISKDPIKLDNFRSGKMTKEDIEFYIEDYNSRLKKTNGWKKGDLMTLEKFKEQDLESVKVTSSLSALMNAYVDIAKDPYITRGNWNTMTANVGFTLLRAGSHPLWVNAYLAQPIIVKYINFIKDRQSILGTETGDAKKEFLKLVGLTAKPYPSKYDTLTLKRLRTNISDDTKFNHALDRKIIHSFFELTDEAKNVNTAIKASKIDVNGYGRNNVGMIIVQNLFNKLKYNPGSSVGNYNSVLEFENSEGLKNKTSMGVFKGHMDYVNDIMKANPSLFLESNTGTIGTFNAISRDIKGENLFDEDLAQKLSSSYYSYIMSNFGPLQMNNDERVELIDSMPERLTEMKAKYPNSEFLNNLYVRLNPRDLKDKGFIVMSNRGKSATFESQMSRGWEQLLQNESDSKFAKDLIRYSYLTSGFQKHRFEFYSYIPTSWFIDNKFNDYINRISKHRDTIIDNVFIEEFARHNSNDKSIVKTVARTAMKVSDNIGIQHGFVTQNETLTRFVSYTPSEDVSNPFEQVAPKPRLYKHAGYDSKGLKVYVRTHTKGSADKSGKKTVQWDYNALEEDRGGSNFKSLEEGISHYQDLVVYKIEDSVLDSNNDIDFNTEELEESFNAKNESIEVGKKVQENEDNARISEKNSLTLQEQKGEVNFNNTNLNKLSSKLQTFITELASNKLYEDELDKVFNTLTVEDKEWLTKSLGRTYKDMKYFKLEDVYSDVSLENIFYYMQTGTLLDKKVQSVTESSNEFLKLQDFVKENKEFVDNFYSLSKEVQKDMKKDLEKLKEKNKYLTEQLPDEYDIRKELLASVDFKDFVSQSTPQSDEGTQLSMFNDVDYYNFKNDENIFHKIDKDNNCKI